jgi:hypothetical protein
MIAAPVITPVPSPDANHYGAVCVVRNIIAAWSDLSDLAGLLTYLHNRGYAVSYIGAAALEQMIDDEIVERDAETK